MADTTIASSRGFTRWQASATHLLISVAIAAVALFVLLRVWYPPPLFTAEGGNDLLFILVAVDVVIGPLITLIVFKSGKPGLRFDLNFLKRRAEKLCGFFRRRTCNPPALVMPQSAIIFTAFATIRQRSTSVRMWQQ